MSMSARQGARLIAIDWGTSNLRASLLGDDGVVLDHRSQPGGVMAVKDGQFEAALLACCGDWIAATGVPLIASGMIGSRQGWSEAPYLACPAGLDAAATQLTRVPLAAGATLHIVPGLNCLGDDGQVDVMRGEETQMWGAHLPPHSVCLLPGTHAKWAWLGADGVVTRFATFMTGELYALLTQHGILGRLMQFGHADAARFADGVTLGLKEHGNATHVIFAARTAGLMGRIDATGLPDFLSGILIGIEIGSALRRGRPASVTLLGDADLCGRYGQALTIAGIAHMFADDQATTRGQWLVATRAGLLGETA